MEDAFVLLDPEAVQVFLECFPGEARRKGVALFRRGAVVELTVQRPGVEYAAVVQEGKPYVTHLSYDPTDGWRGECGCQLGFHCAHIFAASNALLAEHRSALVRGLSGNDTRAANALALSRSRTQAAEISDLAGRLVAATGQPLAPEHVRFLRRIHELYLRAARNRRLTYWDLQELGFNLFSAEYDLKLWPAFPSSEYEFWLYLANGLQERKCEIPQFMLPVSDLTPIKERLTRWRRSLQVEQWERALGNLEQAQPEPSAPAGETDLRLMLTGEEFRLQARGPGKAEFESFNQRQLREFENDYEFGEVVLGLEAELLWRLFADPFDSGTALDLQDVTPESTQVLNKLIRMRILESRLVDQEGKPLARPPEPLRWELTSAADATDDYRLRLVQADGSPPPPILHVAPGSPTLYLTHGSIFAGPWCEASLLDPTQETRIPAPAIERASGVSFLKSLGVELPARLRERVRTLSYDISISCELRQPFWGSQGEELAVTVLAETEDGRQQSWTGDSWATAPGQRGRPKAASGEHIDFYDKARLAEVPALLGPLNLKPSMSGSGGLSTRVTKKFPEVFATWLKTVPPHVQLQLKGELASFLEADFAGRVQLQVTEAEIDWFDLRVVLDISDATLTAEEIKLLLNAKGRYVRLEGRGWRRLQYDLNEDENERLARLGLSPRELSAEPQRLHALQLADESARKFLPADQVESIHRRANELKARVAPELPAGLTAQFRPYQLEGFHFLAYLASNRFGGILADDMGLGKTLQTLVWLLWLGSQSGALSRQEPDAKRQEAPGAAMPSLVVCPKSVMDNWHAEAERFTPGLRVRAWSSGELEGFLENLQSADLHVINYSQLRSLGEGLASLRWMAVILDEGQYIKNPNSQTARVAKSLKATHRLVLSGTPIENRLLDLWSLMSFAMPGVLGNRTQFGRVYDSRNDPLARKRLASRVRPFLLRRTKNQVAKDLPDRIEEDLFCEMEGEQLTLYRAELKRAQQLLLSITTQKELAQHQFHFLTSLLRLRQICCHPRLLDSRWAHPSAKADALMEQLEPLMEEGQKVLVFSQFVQMLDLLQPALKERNWPLFYLAGQTEDRGDLVRSFQAAEGPGVFLISLKAGGFGLNLTAASYVVLFDPWWNPAVESQAIDRTHRIGQTNHVIAYRLLIKNSIEEKIRALQKQKKNLAEDVLGDEKFAQNLTLEDLRFLLAD